MMVTRSCWLGHGQIEVEALLDVIAYKSMIPTGSSVFFVIEQISNHEESRVGGRERTIFICVLQASFN